MICMVAERKWLYFLGGRIEMLGKVKWRETIKASIFTLTRPPLKIMEFLQVKSLWHTLVVVWCPILVKMVILIVNDEMPMTCWRRWERGERGWRPRWGRTARRSTAHWRWSSWSWGWWWWSSWSWGWWWSWVVMGMVVLTMEFMKMLLGKLDTTFRGPICPEPEVSLYTLWNLVLGWTVQYAVCMESFYWKHVTFDWNACLQGNSILGRLVFHAMAASSRGKGWHLFELRGKF